MKLKLLVVGLSLVCVLLLSGCQTARGFGEDVQSGGRAIERSASY